MDTLLIGVVALNISREFRLGKLVQREEPTYLDSMEAQMKKTLGAKFVPYIGPMDPAKDR